MHKKTKALNRIENNMAQMEKGTFRYEVLACAKRFKTSWLELGQYLMSVYKDKMYRDWGYLSFETYCNKEVGIRKETGLKLLRSYYFLEQEEPELIQKKYLESANSTQVPSYEAINTLRQVKTNKSLNIADYERMKQQIFRDGKSDKEIKDVYKSMLKAVKEENDTQEIRRQRRLACLRRMIGSLNALKREIKVNRFLSDKIVAELEKVITKIETEISLNSKLISNQ